MSLLVEDGQIPGGRGENVLMEANLAPRNEIRALLTDNFEAVIPEGPSIRSVELDLKLVAEVARDKGVVLPEVRAITYFNNGNNPKPGFQVAKVEGVVPGEINDAQEKARLFTQAIDFAESLRKKGVFWSAGSNSLRVVDGRRLAMVNPVGIIGAIGSGLDVERFYPDQTKALEQLFGAVRLETGEFSHLTKEQRLQTAKLLVDLEKSMSGKEEWAYDRVNSQVWLILAEGEMALALAKRDGEPEVVLSMVLHWLLRGW